MKSSVLLIALLCAMILSSSSAPTVTNAANAAKKEWAVTKFDRPVRLMDITLQGTYLFVHDDAAMARGEACTYVYKGEAENANNLILSFHCTPVARGKADYFTVRTVPTPTGEFELKEFQFGGSTEAHLVPTSQHEAHITLAP